jgi:hypothetical protein
VVVELETDDMRSPLQGNGLHLAVGRSYQNLEMVGDGVQHRLTVPLKEGKRVGKALEKGMTAPRCSETALSEPHAAADVGTHPGAEDMAEELMSKAEAQEWLSHLEDLSDGRFLRLQEGVLHLLIHVGATPKDHHPMISRRIGNGPVPDLHSIKLDTYAGCGPEKVVSRPFPGHMLDNEET